MKIAIIGAGWVGCHLANRLKKNNQVVLYEKNDIFSESSFFNQNRLHLGYHYSRSYSTRNLCKKTFNRFYNDYSFLIEDVNKNIYSVPLNDSLIDFNTYLKIFDDFNTHQIINIQSLKNVEGSISVEEKYINPIKSKNYFREELEDLIRYENISENNLSSLQKDCDLIINSTNNNLLPILENTFSENCLVILYEKIKDTEFDALTFVDGKLMSIYPYDLNKNLYSLTDVEFTPQANLPVEIVRDKMESKILKYYDNFLNDFKYHSYTKSVKYKIKNFSDNRIPLMKHTDNIVSCFTGKIQGIYTIEDYIKNL
jgi:hypothetical protein